MIGMSNESRRKGSLTVRVVVGQLAGLAVGFAALALLIALAPETDVRIKIGVVLWFATIGTLIGTVGVFSRHPIIGTPIRWWVRGPVVGGWMNLLLVLFAHDELAAIARAALGSDSPVWTSPYWFILEGAAFGAIIGGLATLLGGEGPDSARD